MVSKSVAKEKFDMECRIEELAEDGEISGQIAFYLLKGYWAENDNQI